MPAGVYEHKRQPLAVRFAKKVNKRGKKMPHMKTRCHEWTGATFTNKYGALNEGGHTGRMLPAHVVSWTLRYGDVGAFHVLHKCDNRLCVRTTHLFLGTDQDNADDKCQKGRQAKGESNGRSLLTARDVASIRASKLSRDALAARYGVSKSAIRCILLRLTWK